MGFDPLYVANEGKMLVFISPEDADKVLDKMKQIDMVKRVSSSERWEKLALPITCL